MQTRSRITCTALAVVALLGTGCQNRTGEVEKEELRADNERLTAEITALSKENLILAEQRNKAREENQRLRAHLKGMESQMRDLSGIRMILRNAELPRHQSLNRDGSTCDWLRC